MISFNRPSWISSPEWGSYFNSWRFSSRISFAFSCITSDIPFNFWTALFGIHSTNLRRNHGGPKRTRNGANCRTSERVKMVGLVKSGVSVSGKRMVNGILHEFFDGRRIRVIMRRVQGVKTVTKDRSTDWFQCYSRHPIGHVKSLGLFFSEFSG